MNFIKKFFVVSSFLLLISSILLAPTFVFAQEANQTTFTSEDEVPIKLVINAAVYSNEFRSVSINYTLSNNSKSFVDSLKYTFEFHHGEKLADEGLLFKDLQYVLSTSGPVEKLAPGQTRNETIKYELPSGIPGGKYFIRGIISNNTLSVYGIDYTKEPFSMTGRGTFISEKTAAFLDMNRNTVHNLMEGPLLDVDGKYMVAFARENNASLFKYLDNNEIYSDFSIVNTTNPDEVVFEKKGIPLSKLIREDNLGLGIEIEPWENLQSGSYTGIISFNDSNGEKISESITVRLLYRGLIGRIYDIDTNINSYRKGEPVSLIVNAIVAGDPEAEKAILKAEFKYQGNVVQEIQKELLLNKTFQGIDSNINFDDKEIKRESLIDELVITLSSADGRMLDTQSVDIDTSQIFSHPEKTNIWRNILISLIVLIGLIILVAYLNKKKKLPFKNYLASFIILGSALLASSGIVLAQEYCWESGADNYGAEGACTFSNQNSDPDTGTEEYCWEVDSPSYGQLGPCAQNICTEPGASNYNSEGPCEYDPGNGNQTEACKDSSALNYDPDPNKVENNALCRYPERCTDPGATNYWQFEACQYPPDERCLNPAAINYNQIGQCEYDFICEDESYSSYGEPGPCVTKCEDPDALNNGAEEACRYYCGHPEAVNYGASEKCVLYRDLYKTWRSVNLDEEEVCGTECVNIDYYLRVQCKSCLNAGNNIIVSYYNNWKGTESFEDLTSEVGPFNTSARASFRAWWVGADSDKHFADAQQLKPATEAKLAGTPIAANDVVNEWIFGPFTFRKCWELFNEDGTLKRNELEPDGSYNQNSAVVIKGQFSPDAINGEYYCNATLDGLYTDGYSKEIILFEDACQAPIDVKASFFIDQGGDGEMNAGDFYVRSDNANSNCRGVVNPVSGFIRKSDGSVVYENLTADDCEPDGTPFFGKNQLVPGDWGVGMDDGSLGFVTTGIKYLVDSMWEEHPWITVDPAETLFARIGLQYSNGISLSCSADPESSRSTSEDVVWSADFSGNYDRTDLTFVWTELNATKAQTTKEIYGGTNFGRYSTSYGPGTGGPKEYQVSVYAKNALGETVSNEATCSFTMEEMTVMCKAYPSLDDAVNDRFSSSFFNEREEVWWRAFVTNSDNPISSVKWFGGASTGNEGSDSYIVGPKYFYEKKKSVNASVEVVGSGSSAGYSCPIFIRECMNDSECEDQGLVCDPVEQICVIPPPVFEDELSLDPGVVNKGQRCGLSWEVFNADKCVLYKNGSEDGIEVPTSSMNTPVEIGTYTMNCVDQDEEGNTISIAKSGPVRCLLNPDIKED